MSTVVIMPQKGLTEESAVLSKWYVKAGESVKPGAALFAAEIGKATFDVEAEAEGTVLELFVPEGEDVAIKTPVCVIGKPGESYEKPLSAAADVAAPDAAPENRPTPAVRTQPVSGEAGICASPRAKAAAERQGVDWRKAAPTGAEGRIIERDIDALSAAPNTAEAPGAAVEGEEEFTLRPNSGIRRAIAKNMHDSLANMAQLSMTAYFDASELLALRARVKAGGEKLGCANISLNDMILFAVSRTVLGHPDLNAHYSDREMKLFRHVHLGVAVDTQRGLMVPTLAYADQMSLGQLSDRAKVLAKGCRENTIKPQQLSGGTITVTNLGNTGISTFTPIINPPQTAIVGVTGLEWKLRPGKDGAPELYQAMGLALTIDHRAVDGAPASRFLRELCDNLENFSLLMTK